MTENGKLRFEDWLEKSSLKQIEVYISRVSTALKNERLDKNYHMIAVWRDGLEKANDEIEKRKQKLKENGV